MGKESVVITEKMQSIKEWPSDIAHEVKSPLYSITQGIFYLEKTSDKGRQSELLNLIEEAVMRANKIVHDLLDFSRPVPLELKPYKINKVITKSLLGLVEKQASVKNIRITKNFATNLPLVMIDENQIRKVFINTILNFLDAMPKDRELIIRTYTKELIELKDGIDRKAADFFKLKDPVLICELESTDIGLSENKSSEVSDLLLTTIITRSIIDRHTGLINIESKEGQGTKVIITLPIAKGELRK